MMLLQCLCNRRLGATYVLRYFGTGTLNSLNAGKGKFFESGDLAPVCWVTRLTSAGFSRYNSIREIEVADIPHFLTWIAPVDVAMCW